MHINAPLNREYPLNGTLKIMQIVLLQDIDILMRAALSIDRYFFFLLNGERVRV